MYPFQHFIYGFLFSIFLFLIFPHIGWIGFSMIFYSSVLMDVDKYFYYVKKKKDWSLVNAYNWWVENSQAFLNLSEKQKETVDEGVCFFHGLEVLFILFLLATFVSYYFNYVFIGFAFHLLLDYIHQPFYKKRIDKVSVVHDYVKSKKRVHIEHYRKKK